MTSGVGASSSLVCATELNAVKYPVSIVPALFCAMRCIDNAIFLSGAETTWLELVWGIREKNVDF